eukprot:11211094-Prorocentrum_lima.AAC.1
MHRRSHHKRVRPHGCPSRLLCHTPIHPCHNFRLSTAWRTLAQNLSPNMSVRHCHVQPLPACILPLADW